MTFGPQSLTYALIVCGGLAVLFAYLVYESFRLSGIDLYAPEPLWRQRVNKAVSVVAVLLIGTQTIIAATLAFWLITGRHWGL